MQRAIMNDATAIRRCRLSHDLAQRDFEVDETP
jgi:hypothetical protein